MTGGINPGVVDGAGVLAGLRVHLLQDFNLLVEVIKLVVGVSVRREDGDSTGLVRSANIVEVLHTSDLSKFTRLDVVSFKSIPAGVLLLECLDAHVFLILFKHSWLELKERM